MNTPVAFLIYRRPDLTARVFAEIARARPPVLLVVADGPRSPEEEPLCAAARRVVEAVDWPCDVRRNYAEANMGCRNRVASGLDWVFAEVEEAIVVEDDCLPSPSFFPFCEQLLERYRGDTRIMHVSGNNFQGGIRRTPYSYYFSKYTHIWGWATWRRAWAHYDVDMRRWPEFKASGLMEGICPDPRERRHSTEVFDLAHARKIDTWDYAWRFACWAQSGLAILPEANLVTNIGWGSGATHTMDKQERLDIPSQAIGALVHPPFVVVNEAADRFTCDTIRCPRPSLAARLDRLMDYRHVIGAGIRRTPILGRMWSRWRPAAGDGGL